MKGKAAQSLLLAALLLAAGCSSTRGGDQAQPQRTWHDNARECYERAANGATPTWRGRTGIAACDLYVEDMRYEEARADADYRARLNAIMPYLLQQHQQPAPPPPRQPVNCYTYYIGSTAHTHCQ